MNKRSLTFFLERMLGSLDIFVYIPYYQIICMLLINAQLLYQMSQFLLSQSVQGLVPLRQTYCHQLVSQSKW
ncbi:hypothetical protein DSM25_14135 [Enterococcus faecalis]|nr:hypothetical protein [Enterococcus faecalis]EGO8574926.1 hypothetical protein [Enterococcus faecalis]EGO8940906.1 hypothetical protein [Enterococcus faecalis]EGO9014872.1 hypothetical protein [Enterococcus faecalis]EGO9796807.1 hypothetical protein [Enterococcus faecalis]